MTVLYSTKELQEVSRDASWASTSCEPMLSLDLREFDLTNSEVRRINQWLYSLSLTKIAIADSTCPLLEGLDVIVEDESSMLSVVGCVQRNPLASGLLVQTTRITSQLPVKYGLVVESLAYATLQGGEEFDRWLAENKRQKKLDQVFECEPVKLVRQDNKLCIALARRENRNALSTEMRDALTDAFNLVALDDSIEQVFVSGEGPCFSAGGDLTEFGSCRDVAEAHQIRQLRMPAGYLAGNESKYTFQLHGACIGAGIELPAFASNVQASSDAYFRLPEVGMGLIPGAGGCVSIPRRIGRHRTNLLAILGENLSAEDALSWGLVDKIV